MTNTSSQWVVTILFCIIYIGFAAELIGLVTEFHAFGLAVPFATVYAHNFLFFPVVGLLALIAFWRPTVMIVDALAYEKVKHGRATLGVTALVVLILSALTANAFSNSSVRSLFEIAPQAISADRPVEAEDPALRRAAFQEILIKLKVNANGEDGLSPYRINCDPQWLEFAVSADEQSICFPTGTQISAAECCQARTRFIEFVNATQAETPSNLATIHRLTLPTKMLFLFLLLAMGILLVRLRVPLTKIYGSEVQEVSFQIAIGGALMMLWPLMNATYLETFALLTSDGGSNLYRVTAPLYSFGFGIWAMLLVFFHLRTFPSQIELALKAAGVLVAALGVTQYEEILSYLTRTLGVGGGLVAIIVFATGAGAMVAAMLFGVRPPDFIDPRPVDSDDASVEVS